MQENMAVVMGSHAHITIIRIFIPADFQYYHVKKNGCPKSIATLLEAQGYYCSLFLGLMEFSCVKCCILNMFLVISAVALG